jgi:predicted hotdog family 3-hydroxylacyl-ACP dehydratase
MLASRDTILNYIPQRPPMVMIDTLLEASDTHAVTHLTVTADNIFTDNGSFSEPGLIENIAQTAAAQVGYQCARKQIPVPIGYIAAVKNLAVHRLPPEGAQITTSVRIVNQVLEVTLAEGEVMLAGETICTCEMRIFIKPQNP